MKKRQFITLLLGVVGGLVFALGMCMCLLPEWNALSEGKIVTAVGLVIVVVLGVIGLAKKLKSGVAINWKTVGKTVYGVIAALVLGVGMCMVMVWQMIPFFRSMCFFVTCCMLLFMNTMSAAMDVVLSKAEITRAAQVTFLNVILLSLICTVMDVLRRRVMVDRPLKQIISASEKIMQGDLSVRIARNRSLDVNDEFNTIIDYFNRMTEELSGMETLRTDFIANVSHELKTPLSVIQNYGTMLQQPDLPEKERLEYAKTVTEAARRLANLITNILKLNKLENQEIYPSAEDYDLSEQLCECLLSFEEVWECKNLEIETDIEENRIVHADAEMLSLVWNNLFSNAVKFTEPGGKISLSVKGAGDLAVVKVADTGCGISPEAGAHIFEKFYQGDTSRATAGNGLGLALVKRVMDIVGGDISVESEVGAGSIFTVKVRRKGTWSGSS